MTRTPLTVATHNTHDGAAVARPLGHVVVFTESIPVDRVLSQLGKGWAGMARHGVCIVWREVIFRAEKIKWTRAHDGERRLTPARGYWTLDGTHVASGQPVRIIATHMINGTEKRFVRRLSERRRLWRKHAAMIRASVAEGRKQGRLVIVAGDLNVHRLDVFGMRDAFRARRTYDHVLYTPDHRLHMRLARQGSRAGSDHRPLIASFNLDPAVDDDTGDTHQEASVTYTRLPDDLPDILRAGGLTVAEQPGWRTRGRPASTGRFAPVGVLCHHTATAKTSSDAAVLNLLVKGRSDLPGPLCHLGLDRSGTVHIIASGRANHAGKARASGTVASGDGNSLYIGIEAFNDGRGEPWPKAQYDAYVRLCAVLCQKVTGNSVNTVRGHKETSVTGKVDPLFDMDRFRASVASLMATPPKRKVIPPREHAARRIDAQAKAVKSKRIKRWLQKAAAAVRKGQV